MYVPVPYAKADGEAQRELQELGIEEARMKSDELIEDYCFDATDNQTKAVYPKADVDAAIDELKNELNRAKAREDVLVTDNRDLLDKVKMLEERLHENAEHFKRNESQILENAEKELRHHKYKRCLAMAKWCASRVVVWATEGNEKKSDWYWKWKEKWRELAEKFKPNSTAQQGKG